MEGQNLTIFYPEVHECVIYRPASFWHHDVPTDNFCNAFGAELKKKKKKTLEKEIFNVYK